jgi:hypothetical protein
MKKILLLALGLLCTPAYADSTIDALGAAAALAGTESVPIFQTANPAVKTTAAAIGNTANALNTSAITAGTLAAARMPALTGDCVTTAGAVATTCTEPHPGYVTSSWYFPLGPTTYATTGAATANRILCALVIFPRVVTIRNVAVGVVGAGSSNTQLAIYKNASASPGAVIDSTPSIANTAATTNITGALGADQQVGPGTANGREIWTCNNQNDSTVTYRGASNTVTWGGQYMGSTTLANLLGSGPAVINSKFCAGANCAGGSSTFGTWPATLAGSTWTEQATIVAPLLAVQIVSSP